MEKHLPWEPRCRFYQLRALLAKFRHTLPRNLLFSQPNLSAHISIGSSTSYIAMHTVYFLCLIMLHREYVPFAPLRCKKPVGPLDEPTFPADRYNIPEGFWEESARELFKAARDMMDLLRWAEDEG